MTDDNDLVKKLRMADEYLPLGHDGWEAADRIEELVAANEALTEQLEDARLDAKEAEAYSVWLEGKLAKAREALKEAWFMLTVPHLDYEPEPEEPGLRRIKTTLAELTGDKP
jgi:hypothetical protein